MIFQFLKYPEKYANKRLGLNNINPILKEYIFKNIIRRDKQILNLTPDLVIKKNDNDKLYQKRKEVLNNLKRLKLEQKNTPNRLELSGKYICNENKKLKRKYFLYNEESYDGIINMYNKNVSSISDYINLSENILCEIESNK